MIIKLNGVFWYDMEEKKVSHTSETDEILVPKLRKNINPKTKLIATALWTLSASMTNNLGASAAGMSGSFFQTMQPLNWVFQDIALGLGSLALVAGFILLFVKKRWGTLTLKVTGIVIGGVCLAPAILLLIAIISTMANDALWEAFQNVRDSQNLNQVKEVMGQ